MPNNSITKKTSEIPQRTPQAIPSLAGEGASRIQKVELLGSVGLVFQFYDKWLSFGQPFYSVGIAGQIGRAMSVFGSEEVVKDGNCLAAHITIMLQGVIGS